MKVARYALAGLLLACRSPLEPPFPPYGAVPPDTLERFAIVGGEDPAMLEPIHVLGGSPEADQEEKVEGDGHKTPELQIENIMRSVEEHFPLILAAQEEIVLARGVLEEAEGGFDLNIRAKFESELEGFYDGDQLDVFFEQPTGLWGASFGAGYKLGEGQFPDYDRGLKTNEDGELRVSVQLPLLQNRAIDPRRVAFWRAQVELQQADPTVLEQHLFVTRQAAAAYWRWVSAGRVREIARRVLSLAEDRTEQLEESVAEGELAPINLVENRRLIVDRQAKLVKAEREVEKAAIKLSLFWRDEEGQPRIPADDDLPYDFPPPRSAQDVLVPADEELALGRRPEVRTIDLEVRQLKLEQQLADNKLLPKLDVGVRASQDYGGATSAPDDKGDFELEALVSFDVPLQRRQAKGKLRQVTAKLNQLDQKARFVRDKVVAEVQDARSALTRSWLTIEQARENVRLANELAEAERFQLNEGESDLLRVNLREQQAAAAAARLVDVLEEYFRALVDYRATLGIPYGERADG